MAKVLIALTLFMFAVAAGPVLGQTGEPGAAPEEGFPDATPAEAEEVFVEEFDGTVETLEQQARPLVEENVIEYRGDHVALVAPTAGYQPPVDTSPSPSPETVGEGFGTSTEPDERTPGLILSDTPLRAPSESGEQQPLDLRLEPNAQGFEAANPLVEVTASAEPTEGVSIGEGAERIDIAPAAATEQSPPGRSVEGLGVLYSEVATDTDVIVSASPAGAEVFAQLRSASASERVELAVDLPAGSTLVPSPKGSVAIEREGERIGQISAPAALDAAGVPVDVVMSVEGGALVLDVSHQLESTSYPVLVDPVIDTYGTWGTEAVQWKLGGKWQQEGTTGGWRYVPDDPADDFYARKHGPGGTCWAVAINCWGPGLYVYSRKSRLFTENDYAGFVYSPPRYNPIGGEDNSTEAQIGTTAWVSAVTFNPLQYRLNGDVNGAYSPKIKVGIFQDRGAVDAPFAIGSPKGNSPVDLPAGSNQGFYNTANQGPLRAWNNSNGTASGLENGGKQEGKQVWAQLATPVGRTTTELHELYLGGATISLVDGESPGVTVAASQSTPWFKDSNSRTATATGNDKTATANHGGLGVKSLTATIRRPDLSTSANSTHDFGCDGSHASPCSVSRSHTFSYATNQLPNGISDGIVSAKDALAKSSGYDNFGHWSIKVDRETPEQPTLSGGLLTQNGPGNQLNVSAKDGDPSVDDPWDPADRAVWRSGVQKIELFVDGQLNKTYTYTCNDAMGACPQTKQQSFEPTGVPDGDHTCRVEVSDKAGNPPAVVTRPCYFDSTIETTIDFGPSGRSRSPLAAFGFHASKATATFECRLFDANAQGQKVLPARETSTNCSSPKSYGPLPNGHYRFEVLAIDRKGNRDPTPAARSFEVDTTLGTSPEPDKLGLEQYFHYDSTETGLSGLHANLGTGNAVWHRVPMVNPGRGLSSFLNLTYNSFDYPIGGDLPPVEDNRFDAEYDEFGLGFSASISGVTRMNEPLGNAARLAAPAPTVPGDVALTDPDGTRHVFTLNEEESTGVPTDLSTTVDPKNVALVYDAPPGFDMRLRTYSSVAEDAGSGAVLPEQRDKFWALTRPDGVTYFFDQWGFARSIVDRDGNELRYVYEHVIPATGQSCDELLKPVPGGSTVAHAGCEPRLAAVVDAAGNDPGASAQTVEQRSFEIDYYDAEDLALDPTRLLDPTYLTGLANDVLHRLGKVESISDHKDRSIEFTYDDRGLLESFKELADPGERQTSFTYTDDQGDLTDWPQLTNVTDPRGNVTDIAYEPNEYLPDPNNPTEDLGGERPKRRVASITNRLDHTRTFSYDQNEAEQEDADAQSVTRVEDGRGNEWIAELDGADRPTALVDPLEIRTELDWSEDDGDDDGSTDHGNHVLSQTVATGTDDAATTRFTYNQNGQLLTQTNPDQHTTTLTYCDHPGVHRASGLLLPGAPGPTEGVDRDGTFVSDLTALRRPEGNTWRYEIDSIGRSGTDGSSYCERLKGTDSDPDAEPRVLLGHQTAQIDPEGVRAETTYNANGLITSEVMDPTVAGGSPELNLRTEFSSFEQNGLPKVVHDPEAFDADEGGGEAERNKHRWLYYYDEVGNLEATVDPRGSAGLDPAQKPANTHPFTTTLSYDGIDRLTGEKVPKDSANGVFVQRSYTYDANDNQETLTDAENKVTTTTYTAMDRPKTSTDATGATTAYLYDEEESLTRMVAPSGYATPQGGTFEERTSDGDFTTRFHLDAAGRRVATEQLTTEGQDLLTSYAYDRRGNVTGVSMPRNNTSSAGATVPLTEALANAAGNEQRFAYGYSDADNLLAQVEDPGGLNLRTEYSYDDNDNQIQVIEPRGFSEGPESGFTTQMTYDGRDQMTDSVDPLGAHTRYIRRADGLVTEQISPRGMASGAAGDFTTLYDYDANGHLVSRSVPYVSGQYGLSDAELKQWKVTYERNAVGDPVKITDATGNVAGYKFSNGGGTAYDGQKTAHTFINGFYDNGSLRTSQRPSWWQLDWSAPQHETPDPGQRYTQTDSGLTPDLAVPQGGPTLAEGPGPAAAGAEMAGMAPGPADLPQAGASGDFATVEPESLPDMLPKAGSVDFSYDSEMRLKQVINAAQEVRGLSYDAVGRISEKRWAFPDSPIRHTYSYDRNGNLDSFVDGEGNRAEQPDEQYRWSFGYDQFDRRTSETSPGSRETPGETLDRERTNFAYDPNGNLTQRTLPRRVNGQNLSYGFAYDAVDRLTDETNPAQETWSYGYDAAGNLTSETSPVGSPSVNGSPVQNRTEVEYDAMGRQIEVTEAAGGAWDGSSIARTTTMSYDPDGNLIETVAPGAKPNGSSSEQARITETTYDGRGLPWQSTVGVGTASSRTTVQEFDPNGNLRRTVKPKGVGSDRIADSSDPGYAAGLFDGQGSEQANAAQGLASDAAKHATVGIYDTDNQAGSLHLPWSSQAPWSEGNSGDSAIDFPSGQPSGGSFQSIDQTAENAKRYRQDFGYDNLGRISSVSSPHQGNSTEDIVGYDYFPTDWIKKQSDPVYEEDPDEQDDPDTRLRGRNISFEYDRRGIQTLWVTESYKDRAGGGGEAAFGRRIIREIYPSGLMASRKGAKPDPADPSGTPIRRSYDYFYNPSGSLVRTDDELTQEQIDRLPLGPGATPPARDRTTIIERDRAERQIRVKEDWRDGRDTAFDYYADGTVSSRQTDGQLKASSGGQTVPCPDRNLGGCFYSGGKTTSFTYDALMRERRMRVTGDGPVRVAESDYFSSDDMSVKRRWVERGGVKEDTITETNFWRADGLISEMHIARSGSADKDQSYNYDLNGNRTRDERGKHVFNARDQLVLWQRGSGQKVTPGSHVSYKLNGSGATLLQKDSGADQPPTITYNYLGESDRLEWVDVPAFSTSVGPAPASRSYYVYDDLGNVVQIQTKEGADPEPDPVDSGGACATGGWNQPTDADTVFYCYDEFNRMSTSQSSDPDGTGSKSPEQNHYLYDGLDRRDLSVTKGGSMREHYYVGMSELLSREETDGSSTAYDSYDYDSQGSRQGQATTDSSGTTYHGYGKDANGSVETIEDEDGNVAPDDRYVYDPYGELESSDPTESGEEQLGGEAQDNPFRFQGHYYDSGVESYDMQARQYQPEVGRFLSQDRFAAAAGDLGLQADPLTQNRYAFAGGNPVSTIEFDGHVGCWAPESAVCAARRYANRAQKAIATVKQGVDRRKNPEADDEEAARRVKTLGDIGSGFGAAAEGREIATGAGEEAVKALRDDPLGETLDELGLTDDKRLAIPEVGRAALEKAGPFGEAAGSLLEGKDAQTSLERGGADLATGWAAGKAAAEAACRPPKGYLCAVAPPVAFVAGLFGGDKAADVVETLNVIPSVTVKGFKSPKLDSSGSPGQHIPNFTPPTLDLGFEMQVPDFPQPSINDPGLESSGSPGQDFPSIDLPSIETDP